MLQRQFDILERSACTLARSARPIQQRLNLAWEPITRLKLSDFEAYSQAHELFQNLLEDAGLASDPASSAAVNFTGRSDQECERIAASIFDMFVMLAKVRFGAGYTTV
jgi:hypothetical protein